MKLFKNDVGRPSNETLRKRKIIYLSIAVAVIVSLVAVLGFGYSYFSGKGIIGNSKNTVISPSLQLHIEKLTLELNDEARLAFLAFWNTKKKNSYAQYVVYENDKLLLKSNCAKEFDYDGIPSKYFKVSFPVKEQKEYRIKVSIYSDKKCSKQLGATSKSYRVGLGVLQPRVSFLETSETKFAYKVHPKSSSNTYEKVLFYTDGKVVKTSGCTKSKYNTKISKLNNMLPGGRQHYEVVLYSDSKCTKRFASGTSRKFDVKYVTPELKFASDISKNVYFELESAYVNKSTKTTPIWDLSKSAKTYYYSAGITETKKTGAWKWKELVTCEKITSKANKKLTLSVNSETTKVLLSAKVYTNSKCTDNSYVITESVTLHYDKVAPVFSSVCLRPEKSYYYLEFGGLKDDKSELPRLGAVINTNSSCSSASNKQFITTKSGKIGVTSALAKKKSLKICIWDYAGNLTQKNITLKKCK